MRKVFKSTVFIGTMALFSILATVGVASAVTHLENVKPKATYLNGKTAVEIDATLVCEAEGDVVYFSVVQTQGRYVGTGTLQVSCTDLTTTPEEISGPFTIPALDGLEFRKGPFTLWVKVYDANGFAGGQGFKLKGK